MNLITSTLLYVSLMLVGVLVIWWMTHKTDSQILNLLIQKHETRSQLVACLNLHKPNELIGKLVRITLKLLRMSNQFIKSCFERKSSEVEVGIDLDIEEKQGSPEEPLCPSFEEWASKRLATCKIRLKIHKLNCAIGKSRGVRVMPSIQEEDH